MHNKDCLYLEHVTIKTSNPHSNNGGLEWYTQTLKLPATEVSTGTRVLVVLARAPASSGFYLESGV